MPDTPLKQPADPATRLPVVASNALVSGAAAVGAIAASGAPVAIGVLAVAVAIWPAISTSVQRHQQERMVRWFEALLRGETDPAAVADKVRASMDDPRAAQAVVDHMDAIQRGADDALVPALAALARAHVIDGRPRDRFFRNATGLLTDLNADEAPWLRALCERVLAARPGERIWVELGAGSRAAEIIRASDAARAKWFDGNQLISRSLGEFRGARELLALLKRHLLAEEMVTGFIAASSGPTVALFVRERTERLVATLVAGGVETPPGIDPLGEPKQERG